MTELRNLPGGVAAAVTVHHRRLSIAQITETERRKCRRRTRGRKPGQRNWKVNRWQRTNKRDESEARRPAGRPALPQPPPPPLPVPAIIWVPRSRSRRTMP
ncbi:unnamed protein product [Angiostrongylus costaricensis]|uniref:Uncharacterized protein n=1 Tax=Angiostrongylus costaricensis TaxID=334426 RepID=A0A0R3PV69_ANGCS|nr:unnamed protein product [Angiostrongylus costaricensis]